MVRRDSAVVVAEPVDSVNEEFRRWCERMPKVELHLHLEGAIPYWALWELVGKYDNSSVADLDDLRSRFVYDNFSQFIDAWDWKDDFLREYDDFTFIAKAIAENLVSQNIMYAEVFFAPALFSRRGLSTQGLAAAIRQGLDEVPQAEVSLIVDLVRDTGPARAAETLREAYEAQELGIVGVGLGGSEQRFPARAFGPVYEEARSLGFHTTAHAGEAAGPDSVWQAIEALRVDRIGHGVRAVEDPALMARLRDAQVPVEMCPTSNVSTRVVGSLSEHPVRAFFEAGIMLTVNTDDPQMFNTSLAREYWEIHDWHRFSKDEIRSLIRNAIEAAWLPPGRKAMPRAELERSRTQFS